MLATTAQPPPKAVNPTPINTVVIVADLKFIFSTIYFWQIGAEWRFAFD